MNAGCGWNGSTSGPAALLRQAAERPFRQDLTDIQRRFAEELRRIER